MTIGDRIKASRERANLTQEELGRKCGTTKQTIYKYEIGKVTNIPLGRLQKIADTVGVTAAYLMGLEDPAPDLPLPDVPEIQPLPKMKKWTVLGGVACGEPRYLPLEESIEAPADIRADFLFRCSDDSMINARIYDGDYVFVRRGDVPNGCIGVVRVEDSYSLKRIFHGPDYLELRPENPNYETIVLRGEQLNAEILGLAVKFLSTIR